MTWPCVVLHRDDRRAEIFIFAVATGRDRGVVWIMERAYRGFLPIRPRLARYLARTR